MKPAAFLERGMLVLVLAFAAALLREAIGVRPPAQVFPLFVAGSVLVLAGLAFLRAFSRRAEGGLAEPGRGRTVLVAMLALAVFVTAMRVNYLVATAIFLFAGYVFLMPERSAARLAFAALLAAAVSGFTWLCFAVWLGVNLPG